MALVFLLVVRPAVLAQVMHSLPVLRSMRWPFREILQFDFFFHLFLLARAPGSFARWLPAVALFSLAVFVAPLPFSSVPTLNPLFLDRAAIFSGGAERFWARAKAQLQPTDEIATVIPRRMWRDDSGSIPYSLLGTADFPIYFQVRSISGYSAAAPLDQLPLQTVPAYWFGAFDDEQVVPILIAKPDLKLIELLSVKPLKIGLFANGKMTILTP